MQSSALFPKYFQILFIFCPFCPFSEQLHACSYILEYALVTNKTWLFKMHYQVCRFENVESREFHPPLRFPHANSDTSFKLPVPTPQHMIDWVKEGFDYLVQDQKMVKKSCRVCSISSSDPYKLGNGAFFKQYMGKALHNLGADDTNEIDDDPF